MLTKTRRAIADTFTRIVGRPENAGGRAKSKSAENPAVPLADADVWDGFSYLSAAGEAVTPQRAMRLAAFWQAVNLLAGDMAKLPLECFVRDGRDREVDELHPAHWLVRWAPNDEQTAFEFWNDFFGHLLVWRNAYARIIRNDVGLPKSLLPLLPDRTEPFRFQGRRYYATEVGGELVALPDYDVLHVRGLSFGGQAGLELCYYARDVIGKALARQNTQSKFFERGMRLGGILEIPQAMPKPLADKVEAGFRSTYEHNDNAFAVMVLKDNAKFHAAQATFRDAQLVEVGIEDIREVARLFNCPPHKLGDKSGANYNTLEQENRAYYDSCLGPWMANVKQACWRKLLSQKCRNEGCHFFDYNVGAILWADVHTVATIGNSGVVGGWLVRNEVRRWFNLPGIAGGDVPLVPVNLQADPNYTPAASGDDPAETENEPSPAEGMQTESAEGSNATGSPRCRGGRLLSVRDCSPQWVEPRGGPPGVLVVNPSPNGGTPAGVAQNAVDVDRLNAAVDRLFDDAGRRFAKRLAIAAGRAMRRAGGLERFVAEELPGHLEVGRAMFAPAIESRAALRSSSDPVPGLSPAEVIASGLCYAIEADAVEQWITQNTAENDDGPNAPKQ